jgi:hypothetical protein
MGDLARLADEHGDDFLAGSEVMHTDWLGSDEDYDAVELDLDNGLSLRVTVETVRGDIREERHE